MDDSDCDQWRHRGHSLEDVGSRLWFSIFGGRRHTSESGLESLVTWVAVSV